MKSKFVISLVVIVIIVSVYLVYAESEFSWPFNKCNTKIQKFDQYGFEVKCPENWKIEKWSGLDTTGISFIDIPYYKDGWGPNITMTKGMIGCGQVGQNPLRIKTSSGREFDLYEKEPVEVCTRVGFWIIGLNTLKERYTIDYIIFQNFLSSLNIYRPGGQYNFK